MFPRPMRIIIAGGRDFKDYRLLRTKCDLITRNLNADDITILSGTARGADKLGEQWAENRGLKIERYPADWERFGKYAGIQRNKEMGRNADALIAFWDGESRGTNHMINYARLNGLLIRVIRY